MNPSVWNKQNGCMPFGSPGKWILLTEQLASSRQDNLYSIHRLYCSRPSFSPHFYSGPVFVQGVFVKASFFFTAVHVCERFSRTLCMSAQTSVELRPWGTCEVFNVVKQVHWDRKGSPAKASRLVTLWPSHHRAGSTVGGEVQIALSFSLFPQPSCPSVSL